MSNGAGGGKDSVKEFPVNDPAGKDDFGSIKSMYFKGRTLGMGVPSTNGVKKPINEQHTHKRLKKGGNDHFTDDSGSSRLISPPHSHITSPAGSDSSSAPAVTSPPNEEVPSTLTKGIRDRLSEFKVDSQPGSSASSSNGGSSSSTVAQLEWPKGPLKVSLKRTPTKERGTDRETTNVDSSSPPVRPLNRLVRGKKRSAIESPERLMLDLSQSSPPHHDNPPSLKGSLMSIEKASPPTASAATSISPGPPRPQSFASFLRTIGNNFTQEAAYRAWYQSGKDTAQAISILVSSAPSKNQIQRQAQTTHSVGVGNSESVRGGSLKSPFHGGRPQPTVTTRTIPATSQQPQSQLYVPHQHVNKGVVNKVKTFMIPPMIKSPSPIRVSDPSNSQSLKTLSQANSYPDPQGYKAPIPLHKSPGTPALQKQKRYTSESDDDGRFSDGSAEDYGGESSAALARRESRATDFFNTCSKDELSELAGCNLAQATLVINLRPFESADDFRSRTRKQKGVGNNYMDNYLELVAGMAEIDKLLTDCEKIGKDLSSIMKIWATAGTAGSFSIPEGASSSTAAPDGGLDLVTISEDRVVKDAAASADPAVRNAFKGYIAKQPATMSSTMKLKDYQMLGLNWLHLLYSRKTSCILADDMGLGKTAQVIALIAHVKATGGPGPHLIVVPASTLENWMREFSVFAPSIVVESYYGSQAERAELRRELRYREDLDVIVTTYSIASSSPDDQKFLKKRMDFKIAVFDEGHQLKNSESKKHRDLMQIKAQWRLLLTGTPLQNNLQELISLLSFILPEQFKDASESLRAIFKVNSSSNQNLLSQERISRAKKMMTPFVLRRKKAQVLKDLPNKIERIDMCEMTELQREVYNEAITRSKQTLLQLAEADLEDLAEASVEDDVSKSKLLGKKSNRPSSNKNGNMPNISSGSNVLMDLRKASCHPMLFRRLYTDQMLLSMARDCLKELEFVDRNQDFIFEDMEVMTDFELHRFCLQYRHLQKYALKHDEWMSAGKIKQLQRLLPDLKKKGNRVLLFSQFTQVLDILEVVLDTMGMKYLKLTGSTSVSDRQGLVDEFSMNPDITVFLLSTRAGGLGLNLTASNTVIFYDQDYNPHNDRQAEDRAYRIGQQRDVTVIKLITKDSLEEDMRNLATQKLLLDDSVSSNSQYPSGVAPAVDSDEGNLGQVEKRMRTSLLSNLKKRFETESSEAGILLSSSQGSPKK